ncbi:hypothetical protein K501DRAFT_177574 [Backusella circina FSU 941]|nr:hypothetical protein K501DRAFT_177574 [Backusella circina FSU 941]
MYYISNNIPNNNNVPFNNNTPDSSISTLSSNSNTSPNITTTSSVSSLPSPQLRHNSLTSDTSISSIQFPEEDKPSPPTKNSKLPKNKREKALERNRQAALRCRQRKKDWLNQLQYNVEVLTRENRMLEQQSMSLREEILNLKTILLTHRDCSVSQQPGALDIEKVIYKPVL